MKITKDIEEAVKDFVGSEIDGWIQGYDDDNEDMMRAHSELDNAREFFENDKYEEFLDSEELEDDPVLLEYFLDYVDEYAENSKEYLSDTYDHYNTCYDEEDEEDW